MKVKPVPSVGIVGETALREAAATELGQVTALVRAAVQAKTGGYVSITAIFPARVVVSGEGGRCYAYDYAIDANNQVTLGQRTEVLVAYETVALREAAAGEFNQVMDLLRDELRRHYGLGANDWVNMRAVYDDRVIAERGGRLFEFGYSISDDNKVTLGDPVEVTLEPTPVGKSKIKDKPQREAAPAPEPVGRGLGEAAGVFVEALAADASQPTASRYLVRVIRSGISRNGVDYPAAVLREAAPLFDRTRVFAKNDDDHIKGERKAKDFRNLVGRLVEPRFVESAAGGGEIQAVLEVLESADVAAKLREAVSRDMTDMFGLSIDAAGREKKRGKAREATSIARVDSVDLIISPGAGGQVIRFAEAHQEPDTMRQQMLAKIRARNAKRADELTDASDEDVLTAYREACVEDAPPTQPSSAVSLADVDARLRMIETRANARVTIAESRLPAPLQTRLQTRFAEAETFTAEDVIAAVAAERQLLTQLREADGAHVRGLGQVEAGEDRADKVNRMFDDFWDRAKPTFSFREAYIEVTGDRHVTGLIQNCNLQRMREAVGEARFAEAVSAGTFGDLMGDSITRSVIREYGALEAYGDWRWLVDVVPVNDFRTQERPRMGGYGNLPGVAESGPYNPLTTPGDEKATYAITKRGGTETITLEAIANDDVGTIRRIPLAMATAAGRTLYEFVYDFLALNPTIYDGLALFVAGHNNLGTAALDAASFAAARLAFKKQQELSSNKRLGITLRHLVVPAELEEKAYDLFVRGSNNDETFVQSRKPRVHVVDYCTDVNNWFATADNAQVPLIELGFYGGKEDPEIFIQDQPTQGSLFSNDQIKYKIRHIYSGAVRDYRGLYGSIVP